MASHAIQPLVKIILVMVTRWYVARVSLIKTHDTSIIVHRKSDFKAVSLPTVLCRLTSLQMRREKKKIVGWLQTSLFSMQIKKKKLNIVLLSILFFRILLFRRSRRDIVLASSVHPFRLSVHTFCPSRTISQYLLVRFDSFLEKMISTMDSPYPISLVKLDCLTLELLPLFWYRQL